MRLDVYLSRKGMAKSRTRAAELIENGCVELCGRAVTKPSFEVDENETGITVNEQLRYVGRGGLKLEGALKFFGIDVSGLVCADIGASTGGFTDCLLQHGAAHVFAVDAGHSQLDIKLLYDERVTNIEGCNARYLDESVISEKCSLAVCDLSFISQTLVIPAITKILTGDGKLISLVKPQFECGREALGKNGVVKDKKQHVAAIRRVIMCMRENGLNPRGIMQSPIKGGDGNTEFLIFAAISDITMPGGDTLTENDIREAVRE
ncbi:MAG: TlyA family RNA methyltransferase [Eubacteriales bacterium]